ncbi:hypothetical protein RvY_03623-2 [Ramazzottius varieornatus]|uniref:Uncharacterized protein n=1 Tax=Ramazzottius varieornatus TaxID=947166 RepID=A0A1D1UNR5_RAMVA|nr:hypothetical protein RvY_03623-2 [Ramazzottius varieornatus]
MAQECVSCTPAATKWRKKTLTYSHNIRQQRCPVVLFLLQALFILSNYQPERKSTPKRNHTIRKISRETSIRQARRNTAIALVKAVKFVLKMDTRTCRQTKDQGCVRPAIREKSHRPTKWTTPQRKHGPRSKIFTRRIFNTTISC